MRKLMKQEAGFFEKDQSYWQTSSKSDKGEKETRSILLTSRIKQECYHRPGR